MMALTSYSTTPLLLLLLLLLLVLLVVVHRFTRTTICPGTVPHDNGFLCFQLYLLNERFQTLPLPVIGEWFAITDQTCGCLYPNKRR
jgi:hypothetical protein